MGLFSKKKYLKLAKGFLGRSKNCISIAIPKVQKSLQYAYIQRKLKKRNFRLDWIHSINAGVREHGLRYSQFTCALNRTIVDQVKVQSGIFGKVPQYSYLQATMNGFIIDTPNIRPEDFKQVVRNPVNIQIQHPYKKQILQMQEKIRQQRHPPKKQVKKK